VNPTQVLAFAVAVPLAAIAVVYSSRLRGRMIARLNAHNPPQRQYDRWGWLIVNKRFNLFTRTYYWYEYGRVFGFDALVAQNIVISGLMVVLALALGATMLLTPPR
jgi:hypothetical protein